MRIKIRVTVMHIENFISLSSIPKDWLNKFFYYLYMSYLLLLHLITNKTDSYNFLDWVNLVPWMHCKKQFKSAKSHWNLTTEQKEVEIVFRMPLCNNWEDQQWSPGYKRGNLQQFSATNKLYEIECQTLQLSHNFPSYWITSHTLETRIGLNIGIECQGKGHGWIPILYNSLLST